MGSPDERRTNAIVRNQYRDSVSLMQLSSEIASLEGVDQASIVVASQGNLDLLRDSGLISETVDAGPSDLVIAIEGASQSIETAVERAKELLLSTEGKDSDSRGSPTEKAPRSIGAAVSRVPSANLALISTPGAYAAGEARKALAFGLHVMIFSDNVTEVDERELKRIASEKGLLVMGPDCGTAIINGIPLAFANVVRRGSIGMVAASGTGLQQVSCLIDRFGGGVSQAIGTGGRDLHESIGGTTMLSGLEALTRDPETEVIVLVSKPPAPSVAERIVSAARESGKLVVINFLGPEAENSRSANLQFVATLEDAAAAAVALQKGEAYQSGVEPEPHLVASGRGGRSGSFVRGLFSGGTFCYEALILLSRSLGNVLSNTPIDKRQRLEDVWESHGHTVVDLGDDEFTRGRPHPMIDHGLRNERIIKEAADPDVAVILLDVVLGHGSHPDPAAEMVPAIEEARRVAKREITFVASVCGTEWDPQRARAQQKRLEEAGVLVASSTARAALVAASFAGAGDAGSEEK